MYRKIRTLHLVIGLLVSPYVLMYGVSAVQMAHPTWIPADESTREWDFRLEDGAGDPEELARLARREGNLSGGVRSVKREGETIRFRVERPGTTYAVEVDGVSRTVHVREQRSNLAKFLRGVHHLSGWHDHLPTALLAFVLFGVSAAMVFLGLTGVYLWYKLLAERRMGWIVAAVGLGYSVVLLVLLRAA